MKTVVCGNRQNYDLAPNDESRAFFVFRFGDKRPFLESESIYLTMQSEIGCRLTIEPEST